MRTEINLVYIPAVARLHGMLWLPDDAPRFVLQITHGMTEHIGRYEEFARRLTAHGIAVAGFDLPGHGKNPGFPDCATLGKSGWKQSLDAIRLLHQQLYHRFPDCRHILLGFSLGSFLLRDFLSHTPEQIAGVILIGTGAQPAPVLSILKHIVQKQIEQFGFDSTTPLVKNLSFGTYNKKFKPCRTDADWLCADEQQLDEYLSDSLCCPDISSGLFWQLLDGMQRTGTSACCAAWPEALPTLLLSGKEDPVGGFGQGVKAVENLLRKAGQAQVNTLLIPNARHDVLHEIANGGADAAVQEILHFIDNLEN